MDDTNVMIKCFIFSSHSVTWRTKLQYHAWDFNRNFLSFSIHCCCSIVVFFFFQTFVNEMRISQQPVDLKLKDNIRFGYDIL